MFSEPRIIPHLAGFPPLGVSLETREDQRQILAAASRTEAQRQAAILRALNQHAAPTLRPEMLELKKQVLSGDHAQRVAGLDESIVKRGIAIDRDKLLSLGKERFAQLLAADRAARTEQRVISVGIDLTSFASVFYYALAQSGALGQVPVPRRTTHEQFSGLNQEFDQLRKVTGFVDLWKASGSEPRAIRYIYSFRDVFESLVFGQSLFVWIEDDGRVHHSFFGAGNGEKVRLFEDWLPALKGPHYRVSIKNALAAVVFWLSGERDVPDVIDLAKEWSGLRVPGPAQTRLAQAVLDGFVLNNRDWSLWEFVGRAIRNLPDKFAINTWREQLSKRFRGIDKFHRGIAAHFFKPVTNHLELQVGEQRAFTAKTIAGLLNHLSAVAALAAEETTGSVVARFRDRILCKGKPKAQLSDQIEEKLDAAFPGAAFKVEIES